MEITAYVLRIAEGGKLEVHHNLLGGNHKIGMMAHNSDILGLSQCLVVILVSC
jgi:hypothetical protein